MEKIGLEAVFLTADFQRGTAIYQRAIVSVERQTNQFARSGVGDFGLLQGAVMGVSSAITSHLIGALNQLARNMAHAIGSGVGEAADLEQQISGIRSVIAITDEQAQELTDTMFDIALDPTIQADIFDVADAMDVAARAGARFENIVGGLTRQILVLANATAGDYRRAADILTSAQIVWGLSTEETAAAVDSITAAVNSSKLSLDDYRFSMSNAGGVAQIAGASFRDFNFIMAAAVPAFSGGRRAGQGFASMLSALVPISKRQTMAFQELGLITFDLEKSMAMLANNGVAPAGNEISDIIPQLIKVAQDMGYVTKEGAAGAKEFQQWAKSIGLFDNQLFDVNGNLKQADELIQTLRTALHGLTSEKQIELATSAFGREGMDFAIALANVDPTRLAELNREFANTDAVDIAAQRMDNFRGALEQLKDTIHAITTQIGLELLPVLTDLARVLTAAIAAHAEETVAFFTALGTAMQGFTDALMAGEPPLTAFAAGIEALMKQVGYGNASVNAMSEAILAVGNIIQTNLNTALAFATTHALALQGALNGVLVALGVAVALGTLAAALALLSNPITQLMILSAALGAAWATDFGGMRTAVQWFWNTIQPAVNQLIALLGYLGSIIGTLAADFAAGWNAMAGDANTGISQIGQSMFELGRMAHAWGIELVNALAAGIIAAVGAVITAINILGSIFAYWMSPGSPPRFLPDLDTWGQGAAEAYLAGWSDADFTSLSNFGNDIRAILQNMVATGGLDEEDANPILLALREQMAEALDELNRTGAVSEATFAAIREAAGAAGEEVEAFARQYVALNAAQEAANATADKLTASQEAQTDAQRELEDIKDRIIAGDDTVTMDDYRAALARLQAAKQTVEVSEEEKKLADAKQKDAQKEFDHFKARMGVQNETLSIMGQQAALMERMNKVAATAALKVKEGLTDLEKQLKFHEMIQAHYNDRIRLAELDNILADEKATATEKASAEIEKQVILARMAQREFEATELGFDLSSVYELPIVFADATEKAKALKGAKGGGGIEGIAGALGSLPGLASGFVDSLGGVAGVIGKIDERIVGVKEALAEAMKPFERVFGNVGNETFELPFLTQLREFIDLLKEPIVMPSVDFTAMTPPQEFLDFIKFLEGGDGATVATPAIVGLMGVRDRLNEIVAVLTPTFMAQWQVFWNGVSNPTFGDFGGMTAIIDALGNLRDAFADLMALFGVDNADALQRGIGTFFIGFAGLIGGVVGGVTTVVAGAINLLANGIKVFVKQVELLRFYFDEFIPAFISGDESRLVEAFREGDRQIDEITGLMFGGLVILWETYVGTITGILEGMKTAILGIWEGLYGEIETKTLGFADRMVGSSIIPDMVIDIIAEFLNLDVEVNAAVDTMWAAVESAFEIAKTNLLTTIVNLIREITTRFTETDWGRLGRDLVIQIAEGIVNNLGRIGRAARALVERLIGAAIAAITGQTQGVTPSVNDPNTNSGGTIGGTAQGTPYWRGGKTWVGEQGAELISLANKMFLATRPTVLDLPRGTQIFDATATRRSLASTSATPNFFARQSPVNRAIPASMTNSTVYNTRNYYVSTASAPMQIDRALAVSELLDS